MVEVEALLQLLDLWRQGRRIAGIAVKYLDGDRTTVWGAEQTVDDLQRALFAVPAVAPFGERTAASLHVARRDVVEHQGAGGEMAPGQRGLDGRLALQQPVQRGVEFVVVDRTEAEHFAEAGSGGGRRQRSCGGQLRCRFENAADEQGEDEVAAAIAVGAEDAVEADLACRAKGGGDVAVRQRAGDGEGVVPGGDDSAASQHTAQAFDMGGGPVGEVAEGALTDPALLAVRSHAAGWQAASSGSGRLRYTWLKRSRFGGIVQITNR